MKAPLCLLLFAVATSGAAPQTNVMRFHNLESAGTGFLIAGQYIRESEMVVAAAGMFRQFTVWKTNDSHYRGSAALNNPQENGTTILSRTNGAPFDFIGIDLAGVESYHNGAVTFFGYRGVDLVVTQTFALEAGGNFRTFTTARFTNVTEVQWPQADPARHQFDNVTVVLETNLPAALPVLRILDPVSQVAYPVYVAGLRAGATYWVQSSVDLTNWIWEKSFYPEGTRALAHWLTPPHTATNRLFRVRGP